MAASTPIVLSLFGPFAFNCSGWDLPFTSPCGDSDDVLFPSVPLVHVGCTDWVLISLSWCPLMGARAYSLESRVSNGWLVQILLLTDWPWRETASRWPCLRAFYPPLCLVIKHLVGNLDQVRGRKLMPSVGALGEMKYNRIAFPSSDSGSVAGIPWDAPGVPMGLPLASDWFSLSVTVSFLLPRFPFRIKFFIIGQSLLSTSCPLSLWSSCLCYLGTLDSLVWK